VVLHRDSRTLDDQLCYALIASSAASASCCSTRISSRPAIANCDYWRGREHMLPSARKRHCIKRGIIKRGRIFDLILTVSNRGG
jgi:hypothetical protein